MAHSAEIAEEIGGPVVYRLMQLECVNGLAAAPFRCEGDPDACECSPHGLLDFQPGPLYGGGRTDECQSCDLLADWGECRAQL